MCGFIAGPATCEAMPTQSKAQPSSGAKGRNKKKSVPEPRTPEKAMSVTFSESEEEDSQGEESDPSLLILSESWMPEYRNKEVPLPQGLRNFREWGKTLVVLPKWKKDHLSYDEILQLGRTSREHQRYLTWLHSTYATPAALECDQKGGKRCLVNQPRSQGVDLALFLEAASYAEELEEIDASDRHSGGYRRVFKA